MSTRNIYGKDIEIEKLRERYWRLKFELPNLNKEFELEILNTDETLEKITLYVI
jgi:hypothetical protein